jgi:GT2 family glycosyltransferase
VAVIQRNLSIVILTCNRPDDLELSVRSILAQDIRPAEVVIVDDGEVDPRRIRELLESAGIRIIHHRKDRLGISRSRNIGARLCSGELVMYVDDDERLEPGYIAAILALLDDSRVVAAAGTRIGAIGSEAGRLDPLWNGLERLFLLNGDGHRILRSGFSSPAWDSFTRPTDVEFVSGTATYRRSLFDRYQFDEELERLGPYAFGEDLAFSYKIGREGRRVVTPEARVSHHRSGVSRPSSRHMAYQRLYNQYYIYWHYFRSCCATPIAFAWAIFGKTHLAALRYLTHPTRGRWDDFRGTVDGTLLVSRMALTGGFRPLKRPPSVN